MGPLAAFIVSFAYLVITKKVSHYAISMLKAKKNYEFRYILEDSGVDLICITETWFKPELSDNLYQLNGFNIVRVDRLSHYDYDYEFEPK